MDMRIVVLVLALIGSINPRLEDKWFGGWEKYLKGWGLMWFYLYILFGFVTWLFNIHLSGGMGTQINIGMMYLVSMFLVNGICSYQEQRDTEENEGPSFGSNNYSEIPLDMILLGTFCFVFYVIPVLIYIGVKHFCR